MTATGAVYDRGYRPYDGPRGGRSAARFALWRASVRRALGLRRSWRQKVLPWSLLAIVTIPAIVNVGVAYLTRNTPADSVEIVGHREYVGGPVALLIFIAITGPDIMCPDRRHRVLPIIFARPLTGTDYVLAKVGAMFAIVFGFGFFPHVVLFVGQALVSDAALDYLTDNAEFIWKVPVAVLITALYHALLGIVVAAFTTRRVIAGVVFILGQLVTSVVAGILTGEPEIRSSAWALVDLLALPFYLRDLVFEGRLVEGESALAGVEGGGALAVGVYAVVVVSALIVLLRRYRWVET